MYLEVEWKDDADAQQGDDADQGQQIFLEPGCKMVPFQFQNAQNIV